MNNTLVNVNNTVVNMTSDIAVEVNGNNSTYFMGVASYNTIGEFLEQKFQGKYTIDGEQISYGSDAIEVLVDTLLVEPWDEAAMSIFMQGMATSMTNT